MTASTSEKLINAIYTALAPDTRINLAASRIDIQPAEGTLILDGQVENIASKRIIANLVRQTAGSNYEVEDRLRVKAQAVGDRDLRDTVAEVLGAEPVFASYRLVVEGGGRREVLSDPRPAAGSIEARLQEGVVELHGEVGSITHCRLAEVLIWWLPGCQRVDNRLRSLPPAEDSDSDQALTDAVRIVLEKDPLVHAGQLHVGTAAGVVELDGRLPSEDEHLLVLLDTWAVPGVWEVYDRIEVERVA